MIESYIFNKITNDATLMSLLSAGGGKYHAYPAVVPRGVDFDRALTFSVITAAYVYPAATSINVQLGIFAKTHTDANTVAQALYALFNEDNNDSAEGIEVVYSQRVSETDLGFNYDDGLYQRQATYYFKTR